MKISAAGTLILFSLLLLSPPTTPLSSDSLVSELADLQSTSPTGVIHLTDALLGRISSLPTPRPFQFLIFFDVKKMHSNPQLNLLSLKSEFALVSSSFLSNNPSEKSQIFFFEIEFDESKATFSRFGIETLPHIRLIPPTASDLKSDSIKMEPNDFSGGAESMTAFIESRTNLSIGPINRPPILSKKQILILSAIILVSIPIFIKKLISGNTIFHDKWIWMAGAVFVYFFSVSGAMFNIIRGAPLFMMDREIPGKLVFFYKGSGMQLGTEGFFIGFLYTIVGLFVAFVTQIVIRMRNRSTQRLFMMFFLFVSVWAVSKVVVLDNWKTGYGIHGFWPSSWN